MANAYKNKVVYNGNTLIDISNTTAIAADVNSDKYFYLANGERVQGSQTFYTVSESLTQVSSSNTATKALSGSQLHCDLKPSSGYLISSVTVTMGGIDITDQVFVGDTGQHLIPPTPTYSVTESLSNVSTTNVADEVIEGGQLYCVLTPSSGYLISSVTVTMGGVDITSQVFTGSTDGGSTPAPTPTPADINLQSKSVSITPTETAQSQTVTADSGYDGLDEVEVNVGAISSTYVGSGIDQNDSTDLTASGNTVTAPAGYYASAASKSVASGSASTPATTISVTPSISVNSSGLITASVSGSQNVTPNVSPGYVSSGTAGTVSVSGSNTSQLATQGATTYNTSSSDQTINSGRYLTGNQTIKAVTTSGIDAANIKAGVTVKVGDSNDDDRIAGATGTFTSDANAVAADIASGKTAYVNGSKITGTATIGGGIGTLIQTTALGTLSTTSTSATDTGKTISLASSTQFTDYDLLIVDISVDTLVNNRHTSTVSMVLLTGTSNVSTKNTYTVVSNKWNSKLSSSGTGSTRQSTTAYGVYINGASVSNNTMTLTVYYRQNSNSTGTLNGTYTARVYGVKLYELIGG